jgi:quercetin dioxygenase-like cupin family protein
VTALNHLANVERRVYHCYRPGFFRIAELQISPTQQIPWHKHTVVTDTFYVLEGTINVFLRDPKEKITLGPQDTYAVSYGRPHLVANAGESSATFLVLQGGGEYDNIPLTKSQAKQE